MRRAAVALAAVVAAALASLPSAALAADLNATPATLTGVFAAAHAGDTIVLAPGDYGTFHGGMAPGPVTLRPRAGAAVTMALDFNPASNITVDSLTLTEINIDDAASKNLTVRNSDIPGQTTLRTGVLADASILFAHDVFRDFDKCAMCGEGRIFLPGDTSRPSGITIRDSEFRGGLSDGILNGSNGTRIIDNVFHDLVPGSPDGVHTDAIQLYGSHNTLISGNYFYNVPDAIMSPDGADHELIEDNVIAADPDGYPFAVTLGSDNGSIIAHNTFADGACAFNLRCGIVRIGAKDGDPNGRGTVVRDNVVGEIALDEAHATIAASSHNLIANAPVIGSGDVRGAPSFVGGAHPATFAGYALATGSPGRLDASDGLDRGVRFGGHAPGGVRLPRPGIRVLSTLRQIARTGRLRVAVRGRVAGLVVLGGKLLPGGALHARRPGEPAHSRAVVSLRRVVLTFAGAGRKVAVFRVSRSARRNLGRSRSARLTLSTFADRSRRQLSGSFAVVVKR